MSLPSQRPATSGPEPPIRRSRPPGRPGRSSVSPLLFAFLFLVGLYESWMIPVPVLRRTGLRLGTNLGAVFAPIYARDYARRGAIMRSPNMDRGF